MTPEQILNIPSAKQNFVTSWSILTLPNTIHHITIFTDLKTTVKLTQTGKIINHIINQDPRFKFVKVLYLTFSNSLKNYLSSHTWSNLIQTNRYIYYKIISEPAIIFDNVDNASKYGKKYYQQIYHDELIEYPKYFNTLYTNQYYNKKYTYEIFHNFNYYYIRLNKLLKYYTFEIKESIFHKYVNHWPIAQLLAFAGTEFADKFVFLITNNSWNTVDFTFIYDQTIHGKIEYKWNKTTIERLISFKINGNKKIISTRNNTDLLIKIIDYLKQHMNLIHNEALLFLRVIIAHLNNIVKGNIFKNNKIALP